MKFLGTGINRFVCVCIYNKLLKNLFLNYLSLFYVCVVYQKCYVSVNGSYLLLFSQLLPNLMFVHWLIPVIQCTFVTNILIGQIVSFIFAWKNWLLTSCCYEWHTQTLIFLSYANYFLCSNIWKISNAPFFFFTFFYF